MKEVDYMPHATMTETNPKMKECIENCQDCYTACRDTEVHCLQMGGKHAEASHIRILQDCADICWVSAEFMRRGSELHSQVCKVCADACQKCADDCRRVGGDDDQMQQCADACEKCANSCKEMAQM